MALKAVIGIATVDDPLSVVRVAGVKRALLQARARAEDNVALGCAADAEVLLMEPLVGMNSNFLTETDDVVAAENVALVDFLNAIDIS